MLRNILGFMTLFIISIGIALIVYSLIRKNLHHLLDELIKLPSGTIFYLRLFSIGLFFNVLSASLETKFDLKPEAAFMEYIWTISNGLASVFGNICLFTLGYLTLVTIIVVVLRYRHD